MKNLNLDNMIKGSTEVGHFNSVSKESLALITKILIVKRMQSIKSLADRTQLPRVGLRDWLQTGDDLFLSQENRLTLLKYIGFDPVLKSLSADRVHYIHIARNWSGLPSDGHEAVFCEMLKRIESDMDTKFLIRELDTGFNGAIFKKHKFYALLSPKTKQRILLKVEAPLAKGTIFVGHGQVADTSFEVVHVSDIRDIIEREEITTNEFDVIFEKSSEERKTFKDVEDYCRAMNISPNELYHALRRVVQAKWDSDTKSTKKEQTSEAGKDNPIFERDGISVHDRKPARRSTAQKPAEKNTAVKRKTTKTVRTVHQNESPNVSDTMKGESTSKD